MSQKFKNIEDYGIIGNLATCAFIGNDGSVDWLCLPDLSSPSVFAAILDEDKGGSLRVSPASKYTSSQSYEEDSNILKTTFLSDEGRAVVTDFMKPLRRGTTESTILLRKIECTAGEILVDIGFKPRFDYARSSPELKQKENGILASAGPEQLFLQSSVPLKINDKEASGHIKMREGDYRWLVLQYGQEKFITEDECEDLLNRLKAFWKKWDSSRILSKDVFRGSWHDLVVRSGQVLKLLSNPESGAIAAAATTSLPEEIGGVRNWDYRYTWIRDASFTIQALHHIGHLEEGKRFIQWVENIIKKDQHPSRIQIMYGLGGEENLEEKTLDNLSGYKDSRPVRIGNGAAKQRQLDIYGELINAIYETTRYGKDVSEEVWNSIKTITDYVCEVWDTEDAGIWEVRGGSRHYVYSKLMCWVAVDRAIKMAQEKKNEPLSGKWEKTREDIKTAILDKGFSAELNSFVQSFGSETLDATSLLIPIMGLLPADDPRVQGTIDATLKDLTRDGYLVYRYNSDDGLPGSEGFFILCSFWLVKALAVSGRVEEAENIYQKVLKHISPLGLFAEEID
ncbi:MAG: glycoside hydrolase family 15 protein, partial [Candidatus Omnitrophota bacterium]